MENNLEIEEMYNAEQTDAEQTVLFGADNKEAGRDIAPPPRKSGLRRFIDNLPSMARMGDKAQRRAGGNIIKFLALLLVLTLIARGTSGATLTKVELSSPSRNEIIEAITGNATVSSRDSLDITVPEGLTIVEMLVGAGQTVDYGEALAVFDMTEVNVKLTREATALDKLLLDLEKLDRDERTDSVSMENALRSLRRAQDDYASVQTQGEDDVSAARETLDEAWDKLLEDPDAAALESALRSLNRVKDDYNTTKAQGIANIATAQATLNDAKEADTSAVDSNALDNARRSRNRARDDYNNTRAQGEDDVDFAQIAFDSAVDKEKEKQEIWEADETDADAEKAYIEAQAATVRAQSALDAAKKKAADDLLTYARRLEDAEASYSQALGSYNDNTDKATDAKQAAIDKAKDALSAEEKKAEENLVSASRRLEDAEISFAAAQRDYDKNAEKASDARQTSIDNAQKAFDAAVKKAEDNLLSSARRVEDAQTSLATAERDYNRNTQQSADTAASNSLSAITLRLDIEDKKEAVDNLNMLVINEGVLYADISGVVLTAKAEGSVSGKDALVSFMDGAKGFEAYLLLEKTDADRLVVGDDCRVSAGGGSMYYNPTVTGSVSNIAPPNEQSRVGVTIRLPDGDWSEGQRVDIQVVLSRSTYDQSVPLSAVRSDNTGYYVLTVEQESTVLGIENIVVKIPVTVIASDSDNAAIQGPIGRGSKVITGSNKAVEAGDRIRVDG